MDHGSTGLICFPKEYLYADQLIEALYTMHGTKNLRKVPTTFFSIIYIYIYINVYFFSKICSMIKKNFVK